MNSGKKRINIKKVAALLIIDVQNDFCPGGALAVPYGDKVIKPLSIVARFFSSVGLPVLASRDWHPPKTSHFRDFGGIWPPHCIQGSLGAAFHPDLELPVGTMVISKGTNTDSESYSAFGGRSTNGSSLIEILESLHVKRLFIGGLATDYCVSSSVLDARKAGLEVTVLIDAIAGVDISAGDSEIALEKMRQAGATFCTTDKVNRQVRFCKGT